MTNPTSEQRFMALYWPASRDVLQDLRDHAHACRLRADAGSAPWGRLAAFSAGMTRRSLPRYVEIAERLEIRGNHRGPLNERVQMRGTTAALCDLLHDLIMEGV